MPSMGCTLKYYPSTAFLPSVVSAPFYQEIGFSHFVERCICTLLSRNSINIVILHEVKNLLKADMQQRTKYVASEEILRCAQDDSTRHHGYTFIYPRRLRAPDTTQHKRLPLSLFGLFGQPHLYTRYASSKSLLLFAQY